MVTGENGKTGRSARQLVVLAHKPESEPVTVQRHFTAANCVLGQAKKHVNAK